MPTRLSSRNPTAQRCSENVAAAEMFNLQFGDWVSVASMPVCAFRHRDIRCAANNQPRLGEMYDHGDGACAQPAKQTGGRPLNSEAMTAYQEWLSEWLRCNGDGSRLVADGQNFMTTGIRCFSSISPGAQN